HADARFYAGNGLGWRGGAVIAWSGMRGVVTLAAAQSLPVDFPYRSQLILLAFVVALVTLVAQGGTLPLLIRVLGIRGTDEETAQRELSLLLGELQEAAAGQVLDNPDLRRRDGGRFDEQVLERARRLSARQNGRTTAGEADPLAAQLPELSQLLLDVQQDALNEARSIGATTPAPSPVRRRCWTPAPPAAASPEACWRDDGGAGDPAARTRAGAVRVRHLAHHRRGGCARRRRDPHSRDAAAAVGRAARQPRSRAV